MANINQAIVQALRETRNCDTPLSAIKRIREITGLGLGEAKFVYEYATGSKTCAGPYNGEQVLLATILRAMHEEALVDAGQNSLDREVYLIQQIVNLLHDSSGTRARRVLGYILSRVADLP